MHRSRRCGWSKVMNGNIRFTKSIPDHFLHLPILCNNSQLA